MANIPNFAQFLRERYGDKYPTATELRGAQDDYYRLFRPAYGGPNDYEQNLSAFHQEFFAEPSFPPKQPHKAVKFTAVQLFHHFHTKADPMNNSSAIFLVNDSVRAVRCAYELDAEGKPLAGKTYTFKTLDQSIRPGDICVVETDTRVNHTCVKVFETDVEPDLESSIQLKWIVARVDRAAFSTVVEQEAAMIAKIASAEKRAKREALREKLLKDNPDLADLGIATALPAPPAPPRAAPYDSEEIPMVDSCDDENPFL